MLRFIVARLGVLIPTFIGVTLVAFLLIRLIPGDPIELLVGERGISPERHAMLREQFGLDRPLWQQYLRLSRRARCRATSATRSSRASRCCREFLALFPATVELSLCALLLAILIGLPAGILAGGQARLDLRPSVMGVSLTGYSMPIFWWGLLLIILFSGTLGWTPVSGRIAILYYFPPVTGFMLIDSLLSGQEGAFTLGAAPPDPAGDRARHDPAGGDRAHDPLGDARGAARGLRAHRARQGPAAVARDRPARAAQRADPGGHGDRPAGRPRCSRARS